MKEALTDTPVKENSIEMDLAVQILKNRILTKQLAEARKTVKQLRNRKKEKKR